MKKIQTIAALLLVGVTASSSAFAGHGFPRVAAASDITLDIGTHVKKPKAGSPPEKKKFLYLDMVQRKHPDAIRNAVIVYEHLRTKKQVCLESAATSDAKNVSECLHGPSA